MLLGLLLGLSRLWLPRRVIIQKSCKFLISTVQKSNRTGFVLNQGINGRASIPKLAIETILHHQELGHNEQLDQPAHKVKRKSDDTINQKDDLDLAFTFIDIEFVISDDVTIGVETGLREFDLYELYDIERKEKNDRSIIKIIDESQ